MREITVDGAQAMRPAGDRRAGWRARPVDLADRYRQIVERLKTNAYIERGQPHVTLPDRLTIRVNERQPELRWLVRRHAVPARSPAGRVLDTDTTMPMSNTLVIEDRSNGSQAQRPWSTPMRSSWGGC